MIDESLKTNLPVPLAQMNFFLRPETNPLDKHDEKKK